MSLKDDIVAALVPRAVAGEIAHDLAVEELVRQRDQARDVACEYASRLAEIERELSLAREETTHGATGSAVYIDLKIARALAVASGAAVQIPLRVLVEWHADCRYVQALTPGWHCVNPETGEESGGVAGRCLLVTLREEAAPAAEATT